MAKLKVAGFIVSIVMRRGRKVSEKITARTNAEGLAVGARKNAAASGSTALSHGFAA